MPAAGPAVPDPQQDTVTDCQYPPITISGGRDPRSSPPPSIFREMTLSLVTPPICSEAAGSDKGLQATGGGVPLRPWMGGHGGGGPVSLLVPWWHHHQVHPCKLPHMAPASYGTSALTVVWFWSFFEGWQGGKDLPSCAQGSSGFTSSSFWPRGPSTLWHPPSGAQLKSHTWRCSGTVCVVHGGGICQACTPTLCPLPDPIVPPSRHTHEPVPQCLARSPMSPTVPQLQGQILRGSSAGCPPPQAAERERQAAVHRGG